MRDVIIIGAGVTGLTCARRLTQAGYDPIVLERAAGVGGRCATRLLQNAQPVDHGLFFLHGGDPQFLLELAAVPQPSIAWPQQIIGTGPPCQPEAFSPLETRLCFAAGLNLFPQYLAQNLDVQVHKNVTALHPQPQGWTIAMADGHHEEAHTVIVALAIEQTRRLIKPLDSSHKQMQGIQLLLENVGSIPSLAVIARYDRTPPLAWDVWYPENSAILQAISHDSSKREAPANPVLVFQSRSCWTRHHVDAEPQVWRDAMLAEAATLLGPWAAQPLEAQTHRWSYGRPARGSEFAGPLLVTLPHGGKLGLAGDAFSPGAGIEAAWRSGKQLAQHLFERLP